MSSSSPSRFKIVSCWSKAGVGTSIVLDYCNSPTAGADGKQVNQKKVSHPKDKDKEKTKLNRSPRLPRIVFDLGATPCFDDAISSGVVLISHGHMDHIGAIFSHARAYSLSSQNKPTYYVPTQLVEHLEQARRAMTALDAANDGSGSRKSSLIEMNIVGVQPGDEIVLPIKKHLNGVQLFVRVFGVSHAGCPAVGYIIGSRFAPKLKDKYRNLSGKEIRELVTSGVSIKSDPVEVLEVAYTGDTCASGIMRENLLSPTTFLPNEELAKNDDDRPIASNRSFREQQPLTAQSYKQQAFQCPLILCELTFLEDTEKMRQLSLERGHMHLYDVMPVLKSHKWEEGSKGGGAGSALSHLVLLHLSGRYGAKQALDQISLVVPIQLAHRCSVAISALIEKERTQDTWTNLVHSNGCISVSDYTASKEINNSNNNNNNNNNNN
eukprot:CAMPEP_0195289526 /NCGR_PEP_ID=MMETSP0707-20130614/5766_1 /TAXON_ID=33640 /ORGANISM="Asterionellopsis glacialis, Strain CCMP134" /LENGTH=436 /DNA_ID=CAMNT_0040349543 /DNA_START=126 /DNA_END=1433 /DNA_ORIENTATION=+